MLEIGIQCTLLLRWNINICTVSAFCYCKITGKITTLFPVSSHDTNLLFMRINRLIGMGICKTRTGWLWMADGKMRMEKCGRQNKKKKWKNEKKKIKSINKKKKIEWKMTTTIKKGLTLQCYKTCTHHFGKFSENFPKNLEKSRRSLGENFRNFREPSIRTDIFLKYSFGCPCTFFSGFQ